MIYTEDQYKEFTEKMETKFPKMFENRYGGFAIGAGWWHIVETLCGEIHSYTEWKNNTRKHLLENNPHNVTIPEEVPQVVIEQIKEKFGGLRFYYQGGNDYISGLVTMAEHWAGHTCEECGKPGRSRNGGWIKTLCDEHEAERQARYERHAKENGFEL